MTISSRWHAARARRWLNKCEVVGQQLSLLGKPSIYADGQLRIGNRFHLSSKPVPSHLVAGPGAILDIGDDVSIGCGAAIAAFQHVRVGTGTQIGPYVIIMDTNFHGASGDQAVHHDTRPVIIGNDCVIGSRVTITRGAIIGDGAEILAGSVVSSTIPPGACAAGARARVIGNAGDMASRWDSAAAGLPDLLMASLQLSMPPDIDDTPIRADQWTDAGVSELVSAIEARFGVVLNRAALNESKHFADIAAAVQHALSRRTQSQQFSDTNS